MYDLYVFFLLAASSTRILGTRMATVWMCSIVWAAELSPIFYIIIVLSIVARFHGPVSFRWIDVLPALFHTILFSWYNVAEDENAIAVVAFVAAIAVDYVRRERRVNFSKLTAFAAIVATRIILSNLIELHEAFRALPLILVSMYQVSVLLTLGMEYYAGNVRSAKWLAFAVLNAISFVASGFDPYYYWNTEVTTEACVVLLILFMQE